MGCWAILKKPHSIYCQLFIHDMNKYCQFLVCLESKALTRSISQVIVVHHPENSTLFGNLSRVDQCQHVYDGWLQCEK